MPILQCKMCGDLFDSSLSIRDVCHDCTMILEGTYKRVHNYLHNHAPNKRIDAERLAYELEEDPDTIKFLIEDGWLERDVQTYSNIISKRQELAGEFLNELNIMRERNRIVTYGGIIYRRKKERNHYGGEEYINGTYRM